MSQTKINKKAIFSLIAIVVLLTSMSGIATPIFARANQPGASYAINLTSVNGVDPQLGGVFSSPITLAGNASATNFVGTLAQYHIEVTWGDTTNETIPSWDSLIQTGTNLTGTWSVTHYYSTPGNYSVITKLYHTQSPGAEGTADATYPITGTFNITVSTTTAIALSTASPATVDTYVTATAAVLPTNATGNIDFQVNSPVSQNWETFSSQALATGMATSTPYLLLETGTYTFRACYSSDSTYKPSNSANTTLQVNTQPIPTPTPAPTEQPTPTPTATSSPTETPTNPDSPTPTSTPTITTNPSPDTTTPTTSPTPTTQTTTTTTISGSTTIQTTSNPTPKYTVTFSAQALPTGKSWNITFNGQTKSSTTNSITFSNVPAGQYTWSTPQTINENDATRYQVNGDSTGKIQVTGTTTKTITYLTQYYLTIQSTMGNPTGQGWYNAGSTAQISMQQTSTGNYEFAGWQGIGEGSYTGSSANQSLVVNNPITETANWEQVTNLYSVLGSALIILLLIILGLLLAWKRRKKNQKTQ